MGRRRGAVTLLRDGREDQDFSTALIQVAFTIYAVCRPVDLLATLIRVAFSAGHSRDAAPWRMESFQRACACSLSTSARASSVMFSNSGHGR
jgi:hypothetical protein